MNKLEIAIKTNNIKEFTKQLEITKYVPILEEAYILAVVMKRRKMVKLLMIYVNPYPGLQYARDPVILNDIFKNKMTRLHILEIVKINYKLQISIIY